MSSDVVGFASVVKPSHQRAATGRSHLAVVEADFFSKSAGLPSLHSCGRDGDPVDRAALDRNIAPDSLEAFATEHLTSAGYMIEVRAFMGVSVLIRPTHIFNGGGACDAQLGVCDEAPKQELEVVRGERDVGVQITDNVEPEMLEPIVASIEGVGLGGKLTVAPLWHAHELNPVKVGCV